MATLRELLSELDVQVRAGEEGLDASVRWVHASELEDPTPFLRGGELLLTTGMALTTAEAQEAYVDRLADHGLSGLGLGTGLGHDAVPEALRAAAARRGFPLVEVPYDVPFIAVTERAAARLVNEGYATLQRSIAAQERLQRIVLSERGLDAIVGATASLVRGTVLVFDGRGALRSRADGARPLTEDELTGLADELHERARRAEPRGFVPGSDALARRALALPVLSPDAPTGGVPQAWLVAASDRGTLEAFDRLVLHQAVTATALELLRRRVADATERRLAGDVLNEVVRGEVNGPELARRLEPFGLGARTAALVVDPSGASRAVQASLEGTLAGALRDEALAGLVATTGHLTCALLPGADDEELAEVAERLHGRVASALGTPLPAGLGRPAPLGRARETLHEARCALEARQMSGPPRTNGHAPRAVATFRDLGSFQLLLNLQDTDQLRLFCESLLGPIEQGEGHYGGELMRSLEAFIDANGQWEAAARRLYCHRHTLRYRIRRVEELTGRDLSTARDRIEFWLALRGREMI